MKNRQASNGSLINYTYDLVGNVTQVNSTCPWLQNQSFTENFSYDSTDQLISANEAQSYQLAVNYGNWGKIMQYDLTQTDFINNTSTGDSRLFTYPSDPNNLQVAQTMFAPEQCNGSVDVLFSFGINGSLRKRETMQPQQHTEYYLFNSQGNLKAYSDDIMDFAYYGYNAANTRTYKLSLYNTNIWINGQQEPLNMQLQQAMFYPNTYLNFNGNGEYTKHYYNGTERIASRLGDNTTTIAINSNILEDRKLSLEEHFRVDIHKLIYETVPIDMPPFMDVNALQPTGTPNDIFYYHPNHLGNTAFVTDQNQAITQGFLYAPFGEITTEYNVNFGNNVIPKYSFNAKELDEETGMYYYEARYYKPPVFTSRDPMFEKYFWMSPYAYCANNPVKYVDPSGETVEPAGEEEANAYKNYKNEVSNRIVYWQNKINQKQLSIDNAKTKFGKFFKSIGLKNAKNNLETYTGIQSELNDMELSSIVFRIRMGDNIQASLPSGAGGSTTYNTKTGEIDINIGTAELFTPMQIMAHEFLHGYQYINGDLDFDACGLYGGLFYDQTDEIAAYNRGNLFGNYVDPIQMVETYYRALSKEPKSYNRLTSEEKLQYNKLKEKGIYR